MTDTCRSRMSTWQAKFFGCGMPSIHVYTHVEAYAYMAGNYFGWGFPRRSPAAHLLGEHLDIDGAVVFSYGLHCHGLYSYYQYSYGL